MFSCEPGKIQSCQGEMTPAVGVWKLITTVLSKRHKTRAAVTPEETARSSDVGSHVMETRSAAGRIHCVDVWEGRVSRQRDSDVPYRPAPHAAATQLSDAAAHACPRVLLTDTQSFLKFFKFLQAFQACQITS
jgi:hypothetical protein